MTSGLTGSHVRAAFEHRFGHPPQVVARAPGRVNLIGEHTDYTGGFVLPIAINRSVLVACGASGGDASTFAAPDLGLEYVIDLRRDVQPLPRGHHAAFANYILGVAHAFETRTGRIPNLDVLVTGDLPVGAGLSSSAALNVATASALERVLNMTLEPVEKALLCQHVEHTFAGAPCGIMDPLISILAQPDCALLIDCRSNECAPIRLPEAERLTVLVCDTGVKHAIAGGEYAARRRSCERAAEMLGIESLRDATLGMIESAAKRRTMDDETAKRATHVVLENVRTLLAARALGAGDVEAFANQMFESHKSLRNLFEVSCPELDLIVDTVHHLRAELDEPRLGARMTGGGFGGCAIIACPHALTETVREVVAQRFEADFGRKPASFTTRACGGAAIILRD